ncbi:type IV secretion system protein VirB9 [Rheinheimera pacifica]|uniref:P-type conjugative transfer protein TrbG n=1 Tax=Rheinheimera pacifica TaxID=173990 RepID=UPI002168E298|nr:P-type conjugative transfer protein TrbG [Rheinheimera pacifica]MCS4309502.1 type IV secretion system protein VirB9 [Rheinheimera pacifica]
MMLNRLHPLILVCLAWHSTAAGQEPQRVYEAKPLKPEVIIREVPVHVPVPVQGQLMVLEGKGGENLKSKGGKSAATNNDSELAQSKLLNSTMETATYRPAEQQFFNAIQMYEFMDGALYTVYGAVNNVTDIRLEPGEKMIGQPAGGDTVRWVMGRNVSGSGAGAVEHIIVRPRFPNLQTNLTIYTDRRTYYIRLHSFNESYMAAVSWNYPHSIGLVSQDAFSHAKMQAQGGKKEDEFESAGVGYLDPETLNFSYEIKNMKGKPSWRPVRAYDNGHKTFIQFPDSITTGELPVLFIVTPDKQNIIANYRTIGRYFVLDRLFDKAELRIGTKNKSEIVHIVRGG